MAERTIHIFDKTAVSIFTTAGNPVAGDVIGHALNGDAFGWQMPNNLRLTFPASSVTITFEDSDGVLTDDPYAGDTVIDQRLTQPLTVAGQSWTPSPSSIRWQSPPPVTVENEYEVTLYDAGGLAYRMVGVSITQGYTTTVVGVMFDGPAPPPGVPLFYLQGVSSYSGTGQSVTIPTGVPCFLAGTLIETAHGPRPVEALRIGDPVLTLDRGAQPVRWIGRSTVPGSSALAPIRIARGRFGNRRDLLVSPNHRIFLRAAEAELYFGSHEVLVAAKHLVDGRAIRVEPRPRADYLHLALDAHQIVFSEGIASESLHGGPQTMATLSPAAVAGLRAAFPGIDLARQKLARRCLTAMEVRVLLSRARPEALCLAAPEMSSAA